MSGSVGDLPPQSGNIIRYTIAELRRIGKSAKGNKKSKDGNAKKSAKPVDKFEIERQKFEKEREEHLKARKKNQLNQVGAGIHEESDAILEEMQKSTPSKMTKISFSAILAQAQHEDQKVQLSNEMDALGHYFSSPMESINYGDVSPTSSTKKSRLLSFGIFSDDISGDQDISYALSSNCESNCESNFDDFRFSTDARERGSSFNLSLADNGFDSTTFSRYKDKDDDDIPLDFTNLSLNLVDDNCADAVDLDTSVDVNFSSLMCSTPSDTCMQNENLSPMSRFSSSGIPSSPSQMSEPPRANRRRIDVLSILGFSSGSEKESGSNSSNCSSSLPSESDTQESMLVYQKQPDIVNDPNQTSEVIVSSNGGVSKSLESTNSHSSSFSFNNQRSPAGKKPLPMSAQSVLHLKMLKQKASISSPAISPSDDLNSSSSNSSLSNQKSEEKVSNEERASSTNVSQLRQVVSPFSSPSKSAREPPSALNASIRPASGLSHNASNRVPHRVTNNNNNNSFKSGAMETSSSNFIRPAPALFGSPTPHSPGYYTSSTPAPAPALSPSAFPLHVSHPPLPILEPMSTMSLPIAPTLSDSWPSLSSISSSASPSTGVSVAPTVPASTNPQTMSSPRNNVKSGTSKVTPAISTGPVATTESNPISRTNSGMRRLELSAIFNKPSQR